MELYPTKNTKMPIEREVVVTKLAPADEGAYHYGWELVNVINKQSISQATGYGNDVNNVVICAYNTPVLVLVKRGEEALALVKEDVRQHYAAAETAFLTQINKLTIENAQLKQLLDSLGR